MQLSYPLDGDNDAVPDLQDNCTQIANSAQTDTNMDGFGNICDPDLNDDGMVNFLDLNLLKNAFFSEPGSPAWNADADLTTDGIVNFADLLILKSAFFGAPGPAADPWP